jgi:hypothetical protein
VLCSGKVREHLSDLIGGEGHGKMFRPFCSGEFADLTDLAMKDLVVEEGDGVEGLVLGGCGDLEGLRQMREECVHFRGGHFEGVFLAVKEDEPFDPVSVRFGGSGAQVAKGCGGGNLVEEFGWRVRVPPFIIVSSLSLSPALLRCRGSVQHGAGEGYVHI